MLVQNRLERCANDSVGRLDGGRAQAEVAQDVADADDRQHHRDEAVVARREQPGEHDDGAQLDDESHDQADAGRQGAAGGAASEVGWS